MLLVSVAHAGCENAGSDGMDLEFGPVDEPEEGDIWHEVGEDADWLMNYGWSEEEDGAEVPPAMGPSSGQAAAAFHDACNLFHTLCPHWTFSAASRALLQQQMGVSQWRASAQLNAGNWAMPILAPCH